MGRFKFLNFFRFLLGLFCLGVICACDTSSTVSFKNLASTSQSLPPVNGVAQTSGGLSQKSLSNGGVANLSLGSNPAKITLKSTDGYQVRLNIQGQIAQ